MVAWRRRGIIWETAAIAHLGVTDSRGRCAASVAMVGRLEGGGLKRHSCQSQVLRLHSVPLWWAGSLRQTPDRLMSEPNALFGEDGHMVPLPLARKKKKL